MPRYPTIEFINALVCPPSTKIALVQIMRTFAGAPPVVFYDNCKANLYAAVRRQWTATPQPSDVFLDKLAYYFDNTILPEIKELLSDFHYSYDVWYNHLAKHQQDSMDKLDVHALHARYVNIFCKSEKQLVENGEMPKNRAISAMCEESKYVMGPVVYALEQYFKKFKGYGGGQNWQQTAHTLDAWREAGWTKLIQSDISGMDRSVTQRLKEIIGHQIYKLVEPFVTHVPHDIWAIHAYPKTTRIVSNYYVDKLCESFGSCNMEGEVFSGSSDTLFFNTVVTDVIQRYTMEVELGINKYEYGIKAKGDDSAIAVNSGITNDAIRSAFNRVYYLAKDVKTTYGTYLPKHGSGMTLKYLSISDCLDDFDYCSTNCYRCEQCGFKLTRKFDRFIYLTPWSDAIKNLTRVQQLAYCQNLYEANLYWMKGLPILTQINNFLKTDVKEQYTLVGGKKRTRLLNQVDTEWYNNLFDVQYEQRRTLLQQQFGKSAAYSMLDQISDIRQCCVKAYREWLFNKMGLTDGDILNVENDINTSSGAQYESATLQLALNMYDYYRSTLLLD